MKNKIKDMLCIIFGIVSLLSLILSVLYTFFLRINNPDMTDMRLIIDHPAPTLIGLISVGVFWICFRLFNTKLK